MVTVSQIQELIDALEVALAGPRWWGPGTSVEILQTEDGLRVGGHVPSVDELRRRPEPGRGWTYYSGVHDYYGLLAGRRGGQLVH